MDVAPRSSVSIENTLFETNRAIASLTTPWGGNGGGVAMYNPGDGYDRVLDDDTDEMIKVPRPRGGSLTVVKSIFRRNKAKQGGGLASSKTLQVRLQWVLLEENSAEKAGAALFDDSEDVTIDSVYFSKNIATRCQVEWGMMRMLGLVNKRIQQLLQTLRASPIRLF